MIRKANEQVTKIIHNPHGGDGSITLRSLLNSAEEMNGKGSLFSVITIGPKDTVGYHVHEGEDETIYVVSGQGEVNDNGEIYPFAAGDVLRTMSGQGHHLRNTGTQLLEIVSLILYR